MISALRNLKNPRSDGPGFAGGAYIARFAMCAMNE